MAHLLLSVIKVSSCNDCNIYTFSTQKATKAKGLCIDEISTYITKI